MARGEDVQNGVELDPEDEHARASRARFLAVRFLRHGTTSEERGDRGGRRVVSIDVRGGMEKQLQFRSAITKSAISQFAPLSRSSSLSHLTGIHERKLQKLRKRTMMNFCR